MCEISAIYNKPKYLPFLVYCREHHYQTMDDLARCPFHLLTREPGFNTLLASRVKAIYLTFCKTASSKAVDKTVQPDAAPAKAAPVKAAPAKAPSESEVLILLREYFEKNGDRLISLDDTCKAMGGRVKRSELARLLQTAPWCKAVDKGTFFYVPST